MMRREAEPAFTCWFAQFFKDHRNSDEFLLILKSRCAGFLEKEKRA